MLIEKPRFNNKFGLWQRMKMEGQINASFYAAKRKKDPSLPTTKNMNNETLLAYYAASQISPFTISEEDVRSGPNEIRNIVSLNLVKAIFNSGGPDFEPEKRKIITMRALWIARSNWETTESDPKLSPLQRFYATQVRLDIDSRLEIQPYQSVTVK